MTPEIVALEIREALDFIGEITGRTSNDDILNHIFSRFCIGK
jgi:tRNA modification GTPase